MFTVLFCDLGPAGLVPVPRARAARLRRGSRRAVRGVARPGRRRAAPARLGLVRRPALDPAVGASRRRPARRPGAGQRRLPGLRHRHVRRADGRHPARVRRRSPSGAGRAAGTPDRTSSGPSPACCPRCCRSPTATCWRTTCSTSLINGQLLLPLLGNPVGSESWPLHLPYPFNDDYEVATGVMPHVGGLVRPDRRHRARARRRRRRSPTGTWPARRRPAARRGGRSGRGSSPWSGTPC